MKNVIYKIRNILNDHYYIGSTVNSHKRFWAHRKALRNGTHDCVHLQRAWNKYGEDFFKFEIIEVFERREDLYPAEQKWLDAHFGKTYLYNVASYADSPMRDATPELRAKLAAKTKAWLEASGHPRQGVLHSEESKQLMSLTRAGKAAGPNHYRYGKTVSEETRKKIGDAQRGKPKGPGRRVSAEGMAKIRAAAEAGHYSHWKGRKHTEESIAKMSKPVLVTKSDGTHVRYNSITELRQALGLTPTSVNRAIKSGKPFSRGPNVGMLIQYV